MRAMTTLREPDPLDLPRDLAEIRLHGHVLGLVEAAVDEQDRDGDFVEVGGDVPGFEGA